MYSLKDKFCILYIIPQWCHISFKSYYNLHGFFVCLSNTFIYISQAIISSNYYECKPHYLLYSRSLFMCRYKRIRKQKYIFHCPILFETHTCVWLYLCLYVCVLLCLRSRNCVFEFEYMGTRLKGYRAYCIATNIIQVELTLNFEEKTYTHTYMWGVFVIPFLCKPYWYAMYVLVEVG